MPRPEKYSSTISSGDVTSLAPCLISSFVPIEFTESMFPGITKTSLPCSKAKSTVIIVPLFGLASTTKTPLQIPLIILFRAGKLFLSGLVPSGYSEIIAPPVLIISFASFIFSGGKIVSNPFPKTAIVFLLAFTAPKCAQESIPLASPLTILNPSFDKLYAKF